MPTPEKRRPPGGTDGRASRKGYENALPEYPKQAPAATDLAAAIVAERHRLTLPTARVVCELASIGRAA